MTPEDKASSNADERPLCLSCVSPNESSAHFCLKCGTPLSSYASTGPFEHIFAEGHAYRQAADKPRSWIVVLGIWLIFGMMALFGVFTIAVGTGSVVMRIAIGLGALAISFTMIWKTTRNYLIFKKTEQKQDD